MGWDAFATKDGKTLKYTSVEMGWLPRNLKFRHGFARAEELVKNKTGAVDWCVVHAALDCSDCAEAMEQATGIDAWGDNLSAADVKAATDRAHWDKVEKIEPWAIESARAFLETCRDLGLGVHFSW